MSVVLIGKPNAGKSSLFNLLVERDRRSVVSAQSGTTRDWKCATSRFGWSVIDTPGIEGFTQPEWWGALPGDALYVWVSDSSSCMSGLDEGIAQWLRGSRVIFCSNKSDVGGVVEKDFGFHVVRVSAKKGTGIGRLLQSIEELLPQSPPQDDLEPRFMIVGQPNAGKSSLVNSIAGCARVVVSEVAGTTVDAIDVDSKIGGLVDTPGVKRRDYDGYMYTAVSNAIARIRDFRGVVLLVIDVTLKSVVQDLRLARFVWRTGNPLLILLNKSDLVSGQVSREWRNMISRAVPSPVVLQVSAKTRQNLSKISQYADQLYSAWVRRIGTSEVNRWRLEEVAGKVPTVKYIAQVEAGPPKLLISGKRLTEADRQFVCNKFRQHFGFHSMPIRVEKKLY